MTKEDIKALRVKRMLSQAEMGEVVGVKPITILRWEAGQSVPRARHLRILTTMQENMK